eukprot:PhF_6_TR37654/c0_g1_i1/m.56032
MPSPALFSVCTTYKGSVINIECDIRIERWTTSTDVLRHMRRCLQVEVSVDEFPSFVSVMMYEVNTEAWVPFQDIFQFSSNCQFYVLHEQSEVNASMTTVPPPITSLARKYRIVFDRLKIDVDLAHDPDFNRAVDMVLPPGDHELTYDTFLVLCARFPNLVHSMYSRTLIRESEDEEVRIRRRLLDDIETQNVLERELINTRITMLKDLGTVMDVRKSELMHKEWEILKELQNLVPVAADTEHLYKSTFLTSRKFS